MLRGQFVLRSLTEEVASLRDKADVKVKYTALLLAICNAFQRGKLLNQSEASDYAQMPHRTTGKSYVEMAVEAGHLTAFEDPNDKRVIMLRPTEKTLEAYRNGVAAFVRVIPKIASLTSEEASNLLQSLGGPRT